MELEIHDAGEKSVALVAFVAFVSREWGEERDSRYHDNRINDVTDLQHGPRRGAESEPDGNEAAVFEDPE